MAPHWPAPWGLDADPTEQLAIDEVDARAAACPRPMNPIGIGLGGADAARRGDRTAAAASGCPGILDGSEIWCQLFSEPGAGSDLASLPDARGPRRRRVRRQRAEGVDDARARRAVRHPARAHRSRRAEPQEGITYFVVDMRTPGIEVRPLVQMTGTHEFNEVFFTDVRVPAANVVGTEHDGWRLAKVTLGNERVSLSGEGRALGTRSDCQRRDRPRARARRHDRPPAAPAARPALHRSRRCCGSSGCARCRRACAGSSRVPRRRCARRCPTSTAST